MRNAKNGFNNLLQVRERQEDLEIGWLEKDEKGFDEISKTIKKHKPLQKSKELQKICLARGDSNAFQKLLDEKLHGGFPNNVLYTVYSDDTKEIVSFHSFDSGYPIKQLWEWIDSTLKEKSQHVTVGLIVMWTTVSIILAI